MASDKKQGRDQTKAEPRKVDIHDLSAKKLNRDEEESVKGGKKSIDSELE